MFRGLRSGLGGEGCRSGWMGGKAVGIGETAGRLQNLQVQKGKEGENRNYVVKAKEKLEPMGTKGSFVWTVSPFGRAAAAPKRAGLGSRKGLGAIGFCARM